MNWSGAKNWLIVLFLAINIFLIITLVQLYRQSSVTDKQTIERTAQILSENGINIDKSIIPSYTPRLGIINVKNSIESEYECAKKILGENMVTENENTYSYNGKRIYFDGDIVYFSDYSPSESLPVMTQPEARLYVSGQMSKYGFNMDTADFSINEENGIYNFYIVQKIDKYMLLDSYFYVTLTQKGISEFSGSWFVLSDKQSASGGAERVKSPISTLLDFMRDPIRINKGSDTIDSIILGYTTGDKKTYHLQSTAMPVWCIGCSDGEKYYLSAR